MSFSAQERDRELARIIVEAVLYIERYIGEVSKDEFLMDQKTQDAVCMRLQQVLESASKLSGAVKSSLIIDWPSLIAMRHKVSHHYVDVEAKVVWDVINHLEEFHKLVDWAKSCTQK